MISILIPTYNDVCLPLVEALSEQAQRLWGTGVYLPKDAGEKGNSAGEKGNSAKPKDNGAWEREKEQDSPYEIIVADDGSTDRKVKARNRAINHLPHCRLIERPRNAGRAAIRNFLAREARHDQLLFLDSNMALLRPDFLSRYAKAAGCSDIVYGGYQPQGNLALEGHNLRYAYELSVSRNADPRLREAAPYADFHTANFMVRRAVMLAHPFDERLTLYGYEDVLWGKHMEEHGIGICHIDNPVAFTCTESNTRFLAKTSEAMHTLVLLRHDLQGHSRLLALTARLRPFGGCQLAALLHRLWGARLRRRLAEGKPNVTLFQLYKLGLLCHLLQHQPAS